MKIKPIDDICNLTSPLTWNSDSSIKMVQACRAAAQFHKDNSKVIEHIYNHYGFLPEQINSEKDLSLIPPLNVYAMKYHLIVSQPENLAVLKKTSSGTSGQKTRAWMDEESLNRGQSMLRSLWDQEGLISDQLTNYLVFVQNPNHAKDLGVAFSAKNRTQFAPPKSIEYAINQNKNGDWEFKKEELYKAITKYSEEGLPVRILGITGFIFEFVKFLEKKPQVQLPKGSFLFTTGGWKAAENKKVSREEFQSRAAEAFGLNLKNIRDGYGMAEHGAPYWQCENHRFHIPAYSRIFIKDPEKLVDVNKGEPGLLHLVTPFNTMMPTLSLLTTDFGRILPDACKCGKNSPTFEILGRAGLTKHKGCAIHADEIVKRA